MADSAAASQGFGVLRENRKKIEGLQNQKSETIGSGKQTLFVILSALIGLGFVGLFGLQIITGMAALIVTVVGCAALFGGYKLSVMFSPVMLQKARNARLDMMIQEARDNAPLQLDNQVIQNGQKLAIAREARDKMGAVVKRVENDFATMKPDSQFYEKTRKTVETFQKAYDTVCSNLDKAYIAHQNFEEKVGEFKKMAKITGAANQAMEAMSITGDKESELLLEEAFDAIEDDFNQSIISIENHARDMELENA